MTNQERDTLRENAHAKLTRSPNDPDAVAILKQLDNMSASHKRIQVGLIAWEPHGHSLLSRGYDADTEVASISKLDTHKHREINPEVYELQIRGRQIGTFRNIDEARDAAALYYSNISALGNSEK